MYHVFTQNGKWVIDMQKLTGDTSMTNMHLLRVLVFLERSALTPALTDMLEARVPEPETVDRPEGRVMTPPESEPPPDSDSFKTADDDTIDDVSSDSFKSIETAFAKHVFATRHQTRNKRHMFTTDNQLRPPVEVRYKEIWEMTANGIFPVQRDLRPPTPEEFVKHKAEVEAAMLNELSSWVKHETGKPQRLWQYQQETRLTGPAQQMGHRMEVERRCPQGEGQVMSQRICRAVPEFTTHHFTYCYTHESQACLRHRCTTQLACLVIRRINCIPTGIYLPGMRAKWPPQAAMRLRAPARHFRSASQT